MVRASSKSISIAVLAAVFLTICVFGLLWRYSLLARHTLIRDLQDTPLNARVRVSGVVRFVDGPGKRIWIQDESGALPLLLDPKEYRMESGQVISVSGVKERRFDAALGPASVHLGSLRVVAGTAQVKPPLPMQVPITQLPGADKDGIEVQTTGVIRSATLDRFGRGELIVSTSGPEVLVTVATPAGDYAKLVNAQVRVTGVPELTHELRDLPETHHLWVSAQEGVRVEQANQTSELYTIRKLYTDEEAKAGHAVRLRGRVVDASAGQVVLEDQWGWIECRLEKSLIPQNGSWVEVEGFPTWDGIRAAIWRGRVREIAKSAATGKVEGANLARLTRIRDVHELSPERAALGYPVKVRAVVTYNDPIWHQMYVQDESAGIYVKYAGNPPVTAGTAVTLTGFTDPGNFAPVIAAPRIEVEGKRPLPKPIEVNPMLASSGAADAQYVELEGVVHPIRIGEVPTHPIATFDLASSIGMVHVYTSPAFPDIRKMRIFEDAKVRVKGPLGSLFNARRQLIGYQLLIERLADIETLEVGKADPFALGRTPISNLLRFSPDQPAGHRVKVSGTVTLVEPSYVYVQDATAGVQIRTTTKSIKVGDMVEAVGYPTLVGRYSPILTDAELKRTGHGSAPAPAVRTVESILEGHDDSTMVTVDGRLMTVLRGPARTTLMLQSGVRTFGAQLNAAEHGEDLKNLRLGSVLRLSGVCVMEVDQNRLYTVLDHVPTDFQIVLRSAQDVAVVKAAPLWTTQSTIAVIAILSLMIPTSLLWVMVLRRRVRRQMVELLRAAETGQAVKDLSSSMESVTREQRFDKHVSVRGSEEIAQLVMGFNAMMDELQKRERDKRAAESKLQQMAMNDELTGLPNRRMLFERLSQSLARARRKKFKLGLLYIDLDGFKLVNDNLGHNVGDLLLAQVAERVRGRFRLSDTLARIGGDEFVLILEDVKEREHVEVAARTLLQTLEDPFDVEGHTIRIGASVGIALYPDHGAEGGQLLQQADCAMYAAKNNGKNQIVTFGDDLGNAARERLTLENELRRAVAENAITVEYQPEFDLRTNRIVRFEALARWKHATMGPISPLQFIPIAEECGLIYQLGAAILEGACRDAALWNRAMGRQIQVAVNVSSVQFARDTFVNEVAQTLERTGLEPGLLQIELTESATLTGVERAIEIIQRLKGMGVSVAIDDFGTGYSCLGYLPRLPFDALKIDRSFVNELASNAGSSAFMQSILTMAHNLKMRVIVEGIETERELGMFTILGADEAQGYLLGRPTGDPLAQIEKAEELQRARAAEFAFVD